MRRIKIICFNSDKYDFIKLGIKHYLSKLKHYANVEIIELKEIEDSNNNYLVQLKKEKELIQKHINNNYMTYICDINSNLVDSVQFSRIIDKNINLCFVIGASNGLDDSLKQTYKTISFGKITLPHKLFKVVLLEQIYRGFNIITKTKYHK